MSGSEITSDMKNELRKIMHGLQESEGGACAVGGCESPAVRKGFCETCADKAVDVWHEDEQRRKDDERAEKVDGFIADTIGRAYTRCTWDVIEPRIKKRVGDALAARGSVILTGDPGRGKTHILTCILRDLYLSGAECEVWTCADLFDHLRALAMGDDPKARKNFIHHFREVDWLFLDDLGVGKDSEFVLEQLFRIIDWRSRDESPVVVTSNLTMQELGAKYDRRLSSRLTGLVRQGAGLGLKIEGKDHRKGGKK